MLLLEKLLLLFLDPANITLSPINPTVNETSDAILTCTGFGIPTPTINWFTNNSLLDVGSAYSSGSSVMEFGFPLSNVSGEIEITTSTRTSSGQTIVVSKLRILFVMKSEENVSYTCVGTNNIVNNINATDSITVTLTVQGTLHVTYYLLLW